MTADPLSRKAALDRVKDSGRRASLFGAKPESCPFRGASLNDKRDTWLAGLNEGKAERGRKV